METSFIQPSFKNMRILFLTNNYSFELYDIVFNRALFPFIVLFQDWFHADEILKAKVPLQMKKLGRKVQNFNPYVWGAECDKIMERGLKAKVMIKMFL